MTAANCGIIPSGHFNAKNKTKQKTRTNKQTNKTKSKKQNKNKKQKTLPWSRGRRNPSKLGEVGTDFSDGEDFSRTAKMRNSAIK